MTTVTIEAKGRTYTLTDEHAASSYGVPVLVDEAGTAYASGEAALDVPASHDNVAGAARITTTANAIAGYAQDDHPDNPAVRDLVDRFRRGAPRG